MELFCMQIVGRNTQAALINAEFCMHYLDASAGDPPKSKLQLILPTAMVELLPRRHIHMESTHRELYK